MQTIEAIKTRRSIRRYMDKKIPIEDLLELAGAAMMAPSAHNQQPWQFIIIDDQSILKQIAEFSTYAKMCAHAPAGILVCANISQLPALEFWQQDCAAATQNLLLAAHEKGIGSVWTGIYPQEKRIKNYQELFGLPKDVMPFALVALGYPAEKIREENRFDPQKVHHNGW